MNLNVIFVSVTPKDEALPPVARVAQVYNRFLSTEIEQGPGNLAKRRFVAGSGYDGETLFYDPVRPGAYFVRLCSTGRRVNRFMLREVRVADKIDVVYRFPQTMLADWLCLSKI